MGVVRVEDEERHRATLYGLFASLLTAPPDQPQLERLRALSGGSSSLGRAVAELAAVAATLTDEDIQAEYDDLFIGLGRGQVVPYASFYLTGFLNEKPLSRLRGDLAALGVGRAGHVVEPEDHAGILCEVMAGLIDGAFGPPLPLDRQREFYQTHLAPWWERFFTDLETAPAARLYRPLARIGRLFAGIEAEAFAMLD